MSGKAPGGLVRCTEAAVFFRLLGSPKFKDKLKRAEDRPPPQQAVPVNVPSGLHGKSCEQSPVIIVWRRTAESVGA